MWIMGFSFFDKDKKLLWKHGYTTVPGLRNETVVLAENEVIVGVVAKPFLDYRYAFTDF